MQPLKVLLTVLFTCSSLVGFAQNRQQPTALNEASKKSIVESISKNLTNRYVFADTALKMSNYLKERLKKGAYKTISDPLRLADALTSDLHEVYNDWHLSVKFSPALERKLLDTTRIDEARHEQENLKYNRQKNFGFKNVEILNGNIGYVRLDNFFNPDQEAKEVALSALKFVGNTDALIFDLRYNGGGSANMVKYIYSYLFAEPTHLNDIFYRADNQVKQFWTVPDTSFQKLYHTPVYVLVSSAGTYSAAEEFSYDLQALKRGVVVGEKTNGAAHPVSDHPAGNGFVVSVPYARSINPITKTNWEAVGVKPDTPTPAADALTVAQLEIFKMLLSGSTEPEDIKRFQWQLNGFKAVNGFFKLDQETLQSFTGSYEGNVFSLENGEFYYQRKGEMKIRLFPANNSSMIGKARDYIKVEFVAGPDKKIEKAVFYDQNGPFKTAVRNN